MGGVRRLAAVGTVVVPLVVVVGVFAYGWLRDTVSGAGLSEDNRPAAVVLLSALGAAGWLLGSSILFAIHRSVSRLPRPARALATYSLWGPGFMRSRRAAGRFEADVLPPAVTALPLARLISLAVLELPLLMFTAALVLGLLAQPGVFRAVEAAAVAAMGLTVATWSVLLVRRL